MRIAPATSADLHEVVALEREAVEAPHWPRTEYERIVADGGDGTLQRCLLVVWRGEERVGFAVGKVAACEAELESIAVKLSARRVGLGHALCQAVIAWAWHQGADQMTLEVRASSAGALALYQKLGFVAVGLRKHYYAEPIDDAVLMTLPRPPGL